MENEVKLTPIEEVPLDMMPALRRKRFENLDSDIDAELVATLDDFTTSEESIDFAKVWKTINMVSNAVR